MYYIYIFCIIRRLRRILFNYIFLFCNSRVVALLRFLLQFDLQPQKVPSLIAASEAIALTSFHSLFKSITHRHRRRMLHTCPTKIGMAPFHLRLQLPAFKLIVKPSLSSV